MNDMQILLLNIFFLVMKIYLIQDYLMSHLYF